MVFRRFPMTESFGGLFWCHTHSQCLTEAKTPKQNKTKQNKTLFSLVFFCHSYLFFMIHYLSKQSCAVVMKVLICEQHRTSCVTALTLIQQLAFFINICIDAGGIIPLAIIAASLGASSSPSLSTSSKKFRHFKYQEQQGAPVRPVLSCETLRVQWLASFIFMIAPNSENFMGAVGHASAVSVNL